jgi:preprotein translocase subunit SecD
VRALLNLGDPDDPDARVLLPGELGGEPVTYLLGPRPADATGAIVDGATALLNVATWYVEVDFTAAGGAVFDRLAAQYTAEAQAAGQQLGQMAIVLDDEVVSAPTLEQTSFGGSAVITGDFSKGDAQDLALVLRYGALPIELEIATQQQVSATLGRDQLDAGIAAGIVGFLLVALYMLFWYRVLGLVIIATLGLTAASLYVVVAWLGETQGVTLTLAGVTGLIVSVGLAVDSNIVYFERLKDEVKHGSTVRSAPARGFKRASRTIIAADVVSLLAAGLLWLIAVGSVRGFAFYLGLATLVDLILTYAFMHPVVSLLVRNRKVVERPVWGVAVALHADQRPREALP